MHIYIALNDDEFGAHYINFYSIKFFVFLYKITLLI